MPFKVLYHPGVKQDIHTLNRNLRERIRGAIETRLLMAPHEYGAPLRKTLRGYWKLRVGDYRVVYKITGNDVYVFGILHRRIVYEEISKRV